MHHNETKTPLIRLAKRGVMEPWKAWCIRVGSILVALLLGGLVMSIALPEGSNIFSAYGTIIEGALGKKTAIRQTIKLAVPLLGTALAIASNFQQAGLAAGTDAGKAGFLTALYVVLVPVFGLLFKRKVNLATWIAVGLSVIALYLLCIKGDFSLAPGDLLVLVCAVCFAIHILVIDHFTATVDGMKLSCVQFLVAAVWATIAKVVCVLLGMNGTGDVTSLTSIFAVPDWNAILGCTLPILYVGIFSSGVGYTLQILAQKGSNPTVVTILLSLESVFAVIAGAIILHQHMTPREYLGCALMFLAVVLAQIPLPAKAARGKISKTPPVGGVFRTHAAARKCPLHFCPNWAIILVKKFTESVCTRRSIPHETDTRTTGRARRQQGRRHGQGHENARHVRRRLRRGKDGARHEHLRPHGHQLRHQRHEAGL